MENIQYYSHLCSCGCGGNIEIKKWHKWKGQPKFINSHQNRGKNNPFYGKQHTEEFRKKRSFDMQGEKHPLFGKQHSKDTKQKQSLAKKGKPQSEEAKRKNSESNSGIKNPFYGKQHTNETKQKQSKAKQDIYKGVGNPNWNNGSNFEPYGIEFNNERKELIYARDNYTCQCPDCEHKTVILDAHHIDYNKNNNSLENIITLCRSCHAKTNGKNNRNYWTEFYQNIMETKINDIQD